ncbi:MAG: cell surface protein [Tannerellaceae bacterium]|jgi:PKD repeat protein|nr:cell surface protein [Tannerellaceae bacterium]
MKTIYKYVVIVFCCLVVLVSCTNDNEEDNLPPKISFDSAEPIYTVKVGKVLTITPTISNAGNDAVYTWKIDGKIVSRESSLTYQSDEIGSKFTVFQVITGYGTDEKELRIDVLSLLAPEIVMAVPEGGYSVIVEGDLKFEPEVENSENAKFSWEVNGDEKSNQKDYTFSSAQAGEYNVTFIAKNDDGEDILQFKVKVCTSDEMPFEWMWEQEVFNISVGRTAFIRSYWIKNAFDAKYTWKVDDNIVQEGKDCLYAFKPTAQGTYSVTVTMKNKYIEQFKTFTVNACPPEGTFRRSSTGVANADHGYFFLPAPAQHVNRGSSPTPFSNQEEVNAYFYINPGLREYGGSIGAWGGTLIVGFDHSVANSGDYDLEIEGNAFKGWSEPGIVWVMQDENGDGQPNDTWYELKGSEYGKKGYIQDYAVTYFRGANRKPIAWIDNQGKSGTIDYIHEHTPPTLYPRWLNSESYTIVGSRLPDIVQEVTPGYWETISFEWGYVDNWSTIDMLSNSENPNASFAGNHMRISDAVTYDGKPANLQYIDFVKIQTGVNGKAGWLGEVSTEVGGIRDFNIVRNQ